MVSVSLLDQAPQRGATPRRRRQRQRLGQILVETGLITESQRNYALGALESAAGRHLGEMLVELGMVDEENLAAAMADQLGIPHVTLGCINPPLSVINKIDRRLAERHRCVPIFASEHVLLLAMENPFDVVAMDDIERVTNLTVAVASAAPEVISAGIERLYGP